MVGFLRHTHCPRFIFNGTQITVGRVLSTPIIESFNIEKDVKLSFCSSTVVSVKHALHFQSAEKALHDRVVITVASTAHTDATLMSLQQLLEGMTGVLAALIAVMNQAGWWSPLFDRHCKGIDNQLCRHASGERLGYDTT
jgi:hypothetical protein